MGVVAFLLIGGAVGAGMHHLTRARIAILLADAAIIALTLTAWGMPLIEAVGQGEGARHLAGAVEELAIWLAMAGTALAAGYFVLASRD